jgi:8-oxo-dGTP pyrophosphatase MutT (NUDIX family)
MIESFTAFSNKDGSNNPHKDAAGVVVLLEGDSPKILLVHSTNSSWAKPTLGIPKGKIEEGEIPYDAALREFSEETGLTLSPDQVEKQIQCVEIYKGQVFENCLFYLVCRIKSPAEIGIDGLRIPKDLLQLREIDWAGFIDIESAYEKIVPFQRIILDRLR